MTMTRLHGSIQASGQASGRPTGRAAALRGFSLIEVLLAIFILGVGVISISALFPAGIAQQRLSTDEIYGPIVANNAIDVIRRKLRQDDFGTMESFAGNYVSGTIAGDWPWLRPGIVLADDGATATFDERGVLDVFSSAFPSPALLEASEYPNGFPGSNPVTLYGMPYSQLKYGTSAPRVIITQTDRYYPMRSQVYPTAASDPARPQYVWDCMFRRFNGRVQVAIFVYRVTAQGGGPVMNYHVAKNATNAQVPPLPVSLDLTQATTQADVCVNGPWSVGGFDGDMGTNPTNVADNAIIRGMAPNIRYNPSDARHAWQEPRQWLLDQNNNIHRVVGQARKSNDPTKYLEIELTRPVAPVMRGNNAPSTGTPYFYLAQGPLGTGEYPGFAYDKVVTNLWYVPLTDSENKTLTPVYATVKEL